MQIGASSSKRLKTLEGHGFQAISFDEYLERGKKADVLLLHKRARVRPAAAPSASQSRRGFGLQNLRYESSESESESDSDGGRGSNRPTNYTYWFQPQYWSKIQLALKLHSFKPRTVVRYLKKRYAMPNTTPMFHRLNKSTLRGWFEADGRTLKPRLHAAVIAMESGGNARSVMHPGREEVWRNHKDVELEFIDWMLKLRNTDCGLNSLLIAFQMKAFLFARAPGILKERGGSFTVSRSYVRQWARDRLGWSFRKPTSTASNLPLDWKEKGEVLTLRIAYLVYAWCIPMSLVVNADQTGLHLIPVGNERTYAAKGARDVNVAGRGDKRQVTVLMSCSVAGDVLPGQVIFEGRTVRSLPRKRQAQRLSLHGWHLTFTEKHWSTLASMQDYVRKIFVSYVKSICVRDGLDFAHQRSVLVLDCYSVHTGAQFCEWLKAKYPLIHLVFVPGNCTSKLKPCDVVLQRPFKAEIHKRFSEFAVLEIGRQLAKGMEADSLKIDSHVGPLRDELCGWLFNSWDQLCSRKAMIQRGWERIGLLAAWEKSTQVKVVRRNMEKELFGPQVEVKEEEQASDDNWYGDANIDDLIGNASKETAIIDLDEISDSDGDGDKGDDREVVHAAGQDDDGGEDVRGGEEFAQQLPTLSQILEEFDQHLPALSQISDATVDLLSLGSHVPATRAFEVPSFALSDSLNPSFL